MGVWNGRNRNKSADFGTHECVPYTVPRVGRGIPKFANAARDGHGPSPTGCSGTIVVRRYRQAGRGGMVGGVFDIGGRKWSN